MLCFHRQIQTSGCSCACRQSLVGSNQLLDTHQRSVLKETSTHFGCTHSCLQITDCTLCFRLEDTHTHILPYTCTKPSPAYLVSSDTAAPSSVNSSLGRRCLRNTILHHWPREESTILKTAVFNEPLAKKDNLNRLTQLI